MCSRRIDRAVSDLSLVIRIPGLVQNMNVSRSIQSNPDASRSRHEDRDPHLSGLKVLHDAVTLGLLDRARDDLAADPHSAEIAIDHLCGLAELARDDSLIVAVRIIRVDTTLCEVLQQVWDLA